MAVYESEEDLQRISTLCLRTLQLFAQCADSDAESLEEIRAVAVASRTRAARRGKEDVAGTEGATCRRAKCRIHAQEGSSDAFGSSLAVLRRPRQKTKGDEQRSRGGCESSQKQIETRGPDAKQRERWQNLLYAPCVYCR